MKFILTGATGFVGGEVLSQCRRNPAITHIVVLTRRPLPAPLAADPKVHAIIMEDFSTYPADVVQQLEGADACIWCVRFAAVGARAAVPEVEIGYPLAFARALASTRTATPPEKPKPFRYVYCSGIAAERDQTKPLWFAQTVRRVKGEAENSMIAFAERAEHEGKWETYIVKPATVLRTEGDFLKSRLAVLGAVRVDELAAAMIDVVSRGSVGKTVFGL
ncbi:hypothetical protein C8R44DRAFT_628851 [Mycena epipterygia]|nr:hypothetical protein C8R44DRAFT_628851 [Mycena epipterygia]